VVPVPRFATADIDPLDSAPSSETVGAVVKPEPPLTTSITIFVAKVALESMTAYAEHVLLNDTVGLRV
jgi:hypothetical protein